MTNDQTECLARVDAEIEFVNETFYKPSTAMLDIRDRVIRVLYALRTVIEKHGAKEFPDLEDSNDPEIRNFLDHHRPCKCGVIKCQTITDIKKELGI